MCLFIIVIGNFFLFILGGNQKDIGQNHYGACVFCCFVVFLAGEIKEMSHFLI